MPGKLKALVRSEYLPFRSAFVSGASFGFPCSPASRRSEASDSHDYATDDGFRDSFSPGTGSEVAVRVALGASLFSALISY